MITIDELKKSKNIVDILMDSEGGKAKLVQIGRDVVHGHDLDEISRQDWKITVDEAMKIAQQTFETKNTPWPGASNIKFPLITNAAIQYAAKTLPEIIQNERIVKCSVIGSDFTEEKFKSASRVSMHMSYQLLNESPDWEDGMQQLFQMLPIVGTVFKKTYYSPSEKRVVSELCVPDKIVVNYNTRSLESARRITHTLQMYANDIVERQRRGIFSDHMPVDSLVCQPGKELDEDAPIDLLEQHCWLDLDDDGYREPYIATVHRQSQTVLRIVARYGKIEKNSDNEVVSISAENYFTDYHFIKSPDGGFYSMGFGSLLLPLNSAINTLWNQLIDSGTLHTQQGGFIGRGVRIKNGDLKLKNGEWKVLDSASGTDLRGSIFPIPTKEPSATLYNMLNMAIQVGKELSATTDITQGQGETQNVSNGVQQSAIEQGTKVYTAVNKGVYRSLKKEYNRIYDLNCEHLTQKEYAAVLDDPEADKQKDYIKGNLDIRPVADPSISSVAQRMAKGQILMSLRTADPRAVDTYTLNSIHLDQNQIDQILPPPDPNAQPSPEAQALLAEARLNLTKAKEIELTTAMSMQSNATANDAQIKAMECDARIKESQARVWKIQKDALHNDNKMAIVANKSQSQINLNDVQAAHKIQNDSQTQQLDAVKEINKARASATEQQIELLKIQHEKEGKSEEGTD